MNLSRSISKYTAITRINLQSNLAYVGEFASRPIFMIVILYVFIQLWRTTYSVTGTDQIAGLALTDGFHMVGVDILKVGTYGVKLQFDTREMPVDAVIQRLMPDHAVADINVLDPPLEEIIARIYQEPAEIEH